MIESTVFNNLSSTPSKVLIGVKKQKMAFDFVVLMLGINGINNNISL